jgi:hypothetical protein
LDRFFHLLGIPAWEIDRVYSLLQRRYPLAGYWFRTLGASTETGYRLEVIGKAHSHPDVRLVVSHAILEPDNEGTARVNLCGGLDVFKVRRERGVDSHIVWQI